MRSGMPAEPQTYDSERFAELGRSRLELRELNGADYAAALADAPEVPLLQAAPWANVKSEWRHRRFGLFRDGDLRAVGQVLFRPLPLGLEMGYLAFGPVVLDAGEVLDRFLFLRELKRTLRTTRCFLLKVHLPDLRKVFPLGGEEPEADAERDAAVLLLMSRLGFVHQGFERELDSTVQPRYQAFIYQDRWPEKPSGKLRYNLRQVARRAVDVAPAGHDNLEGFLHCIEKTEERQDIRLRDADYYRLLLDEFGDDAVLYHAVLDGGKGLEKARADLKAVDAELANLPDNQPKKERQLREQRQSRVKMLEFFEELPVREPTVISSALAVHLPGLSEMPYAGSDENYFEIPASWAIYAAVANDTFARGGAKLNLGGVDGNFDDGLSRFKAHFDPLIEENYGEFDLALKPFWAKLFETALRLRRKLRS